MYISSNESESIVKTTLLSFSKMSKKFSIHGKQPSWICCAISVNAEKTATRLSLERLSIENVLNNSWTNWDVISTGKPLIADKNRS